MNGLNVEVAVNGNAVDDQNELLELGELQLALVGGGIADVVVA
jgi:hypothetical protein